MSGGSFNYLCHVLDAADLMQRENDLSEMAEALSAYPNGDAAARETEDILASIRTARRRLEVRMARLTKVWGAVEWEHSGDTGREDTLKAIAAYNGEAL